MIDKEEANRFAAAGEPEQGGPTCRLHPDPHDDGDDEPGFSRLERPVSGEEWEEAEPVEETVTAESIAALEEQLDAAEKKAEEHRVNYLRMLAEMDNLRKRTQREVDQARRFAIEGFARDLLPVADNLERALGAVVSSQGEGEGDPAVKALVDGVRLIQNELTRSFGKHGVVRIEALNAPFDPNLHQAMMQIDNGNAAPGTVVQELQPGYLLNDRLLRPAMVGVSKG